MSQSGLECFAIFIVHYSGLEWVRIGYSELDFFRRLMCNVTKGRTPYITLLRVGPHTSHYCGLGDKCIRLLRVRRPVHQITVG